jgi:hypothetical protein
MSKYRKSSVLYDIVGMVVWWLATVTRKYGDK